MYISAQTYHMMQISYTYHSVSSTIHRQHMRLNPQVTYHTGVLSAPNPPLHEWRIWSTDCLIPTLPSLIGGLGIDVLSAGILSLGSTA